MNHHDHGETESLPQQIKHSRIREMLDAFATGELARDEMALVERHLASCRNCQQALQEIDLFRALLRKLALPVSSDQLQAQSSGEEIISKVEQIIQEATWMDEPPLPKTDPIQPVARRKDDRWGRRLSLWAAVLCAIFLVGSLLFTLQRVSQSKLATVMPLTQSHPDIIWNSMSMVDAQTGWGEISRIVQPDSLFNRQQMIVRTTDGGLHWQDVSPPHNRWRAWVSEVFVNATTAWGLASPDPEGRVQSEHTALLRTTDGGQTWSVINVPNLSSMDASQISALDAQHCWIYTADGLVKRNLLSTSDGGQHWQILARPVSPSATGSNIENLTFLNAQTGWATGLNSTKTIPWLYMTGDGGRTWRLQDLALPLKGDTFEISIDSPVFFNSTDGILTVSLMPTSNSLAYTFFYQTHDGGLSWQHTGVNTLPGTSRMQNAVVLSMKHWMVFDEQMTWSQAGRPSLTLYETLDGGKSWRHTTPRLAYHYVGISNFVSPSIGWGLGNNMPESYPAGAFRDVLLQTTDGGQTWLAARYTLIW